MRILPICQSVIKTLEVWLKAQATLLSCLPEITFSREKQPKGKFRPRMKVWKSVRRMHKNCIQSADLFIYSFTFINTSDQHKAAYVLFDYKSVSPEGKWWGLCEGRVHNHSPWLRRNVVISTFMFIAVHTLVVIYTKWVPSKLELNKNLSLK